MRVNVPFSMSEESCGKSMEMWGSSRQSWLEVEVENFLILEVSQHIAQINPTLLKIEQPNEFSTE